MKALEFNCSHEWVADGQTFASGTHKIERPSDELARLAGSAHSAGVIDVFAGLVDDHVEPQEVSEAKLAEAMGEWSDPTWNADGTSTPGFWNGPWAEAHLEQSARDAEAREAAADLADIVTAFEIADVDVDDLKGVL